MVDEILFMYSWERQRKVEIFVRISDLFKFMKLVHFKIAWSKVQIGNILSALIKFKLTLKVIRVEIRRLQISVAHGCWEV